MIILIYIPKCFHLKSNDHIMSAIPRRITKELTRLNKSPPPGMTVSVDDKDIRYLKIALEGPDSSPYQGGLFYLEMYLGDQYPMVPQRLDS